MQAIESNKKLTEGYLELFKNLSPSVQADLISGLSDLLKQNSKPGKSLATMFAEFIPEKPADDVITELKLARNFSHDREVF